MSRSNTTFHKANGDHGGKNILDPLNFQESILKLTCPYYGTLSKIKGVSTEASYRQSGKPVKGTSRNKNESRPASFCRGGGCQLQTPEDHKGFGANGFIGSAESLDVQHQPTW